MGKELALPDDRKYDGKAMRGLSDQRRAFVIAMLQEGPKPGAAMAAAEKVGYHPFYGYELMRDEAILAAVREESSKMIASGVLVGTAVLLEIAQDESHKDRFRAARELTQLNGFTPEQRIVVEHVAPDIKGQIDQIRKMATQLGFDPATLIAQAGIVDGDFTDVDMEPPTDG